MSSDRRWRVRISIRAFALGALIGASSDPATAVDPPTITDPVGACIFRPATLKTLSWRQPLPPCAFCEQFFEIEFSTREDFQTIDHTEGAHFLSATEFSHQFDDGWRPNMRHCVRLRRTYPQESPTSEPVCWIASYPRPPDAPRLKGSRDGLVSPDLLTDFGESEGSCGYQVVIARNPSLTDVTRTIDFLNPGRQPFTYTSDGTATSLGRRFYWSACGINPLNQRTCAEPRVWTDPHGEQCAQITVSSGIGVGGERFDHLDTCIDEVFPAPNGYGNFLRDRSKTLLASQTGRHYHPGGKMSGVASIDTGDDRIQTNDEGDPWPFIRSSDRSFDSDDPITRGGVTVHYNTGLTYETIRDLVGYVPTWPDPTYGCKPGNGLTSYVGAKELPEQPCSDNAAWSRRLFSVTYCLPGPKALDTAGDMDITAHELGHALTQCNSRLAEDAEYGSMLDEFFGDAVAVAVAARTGRGGDLWVISDRLVTGGIRNLRDPSLNQQPSLFEGQYWRSFSLPECQLPQGDCYHRNATVPGHMFYLLANGGTGGAHGEVSVPGLGLDRAFAIVAKTEAMYWTNRTRDLPTARDGMLAAALSAFGSEAAGAVDAAWRAVNVSGGSDPLPTPRPTPTPRLCGGDCNQDGLVTIDELVTIVRAILADTPDVSTCPLVDANNDGVIFVSDAVAAVYNALSGCGAHPQIAAVSSDDVSAAAGDATIELGSAFARPGESVTVDLRLRQAPADTVAFQAEIVLPPGIEITSCRAPETQPQGVATFAFPAPIGARAAQRVRIIGIDLEDNTVQLSDGVIATCSLAVSPDVGYGPHPLELRSFGLSSDRGVSIFPKGVSGVVTVTECTGTLQLGCFNEIADPNDSLKVRAGRRVDWRWQTRQSIPLDDPASGHYRFCVYDTDEAGVHLVTAMDAPVASAWRTLGPSVRRYEDRTLGVRRLELRTIGSSGLRLRVQGVRPVSMPPMPLAHDGPVAVEFGTDRACWLALYRAPAKFNDERRFYDANQ